MVSMVLNERAVITLLELLPATTRPDDAARVAAERKAGVAKARLMEGNMVVNTVIMLCCEENDDGDDRTVK